MTNKVKTSPKLDRLIAELPDSLNNSQYLDAQLLILHKNPGKWALVREDITLGSYTASYQKRGCELTYRRRENGRYNLYARVPVCPIPSEVIFPTKIILAHQNFCGRGPVDVTE